MYGAHTFTHNGASLDTDWPPVLFLLVPDQVQPRLFNEKIAPSLKSTAVIVVASGYNVFFKLLDFGSANDVIMVAPRYFYSLE